MSDYSEPSALSGYHVDAPITIKAEAIRKANNRSHLIFMSTLYNAS